MAAVQKTLADSEIASGGALDAAAVLDLRRAIYSRDRVTRMDFSSLLASRADRGSRRLSGICRPSRGGRHRSSGPPVRSARLHRFLRRRLAHRPIERMAAACLARPNSPCWRACCATRCLRRDPRRICRTRGRESRSVRPPGSDRRGRPCAGNRHRKRRRSPSQPGFCADRRLIPSCDAGIGGGLIRHCACDRRRVERRLVRRLLRQGDRQLSDGRRFPLDADRR